jgi:DNA-damage-inducible protein D
LIMGDPTHIALFRGKEIRKTLHAGEWFFVVQDVVAALTDSLDPRQYIKKMRSRDSEFEQGWVQLVPPFPYQLQVAHKRISRKQVCCKAG